MIGWLSFVFVDVLFFVFSVSTTLSRMGRIVAADRIAIIEVDQRWMRIANTSQVLGPRTVVQVFQHAVSTRVIVVLANLSFQVVQIAKANRASRASVLASGRDFVGADWTTAFVLGLDLDVLDSLYTVSTLCLLYTSPSPRDRQKSRMPSSA